MLQEAFKQHQSGDLVSAEKSYRQVLSDDPNNPDALHFLGLIYHAKNQPERAFNWVKKAIKHAPDHAPAWNSLCGIHLNQNQIPEAKAAGQKALELDANLEDAYINLAQIHLRLGEIESAQTMLETVLKIEPDHVAGLHLSGQLLIDQGEIESGLKHLKRAADLDSQNPRLLAALARGFLLEGAVSMAAATLDRVTALQADFHAAWCLQVQCLCLTGDEQMASECLAKAQALNNENALSKTAEAALACSQNRWQAALELLSPVEGFESAEIFDLRNLANAYGHTGDINHAAQLHARIAHHPHSQLNDILIWLESLAYTGQHQQRPQAIEQALARFPNSIGVQQHAALFYAESGQIDLAFDSLTALQNKKQLNPPLFLALTNILLRKDKADQALACLDELAQTEGWKADVNTLLLRARVLDHLHQYDEAKEHIQAVSETLVQLAPTARQRYEALHSQLDQYTSAKPLAAITPDKMHKIFFISGLPGSGMGELIRNVSASNQVQILTDRLSGSHAREDFLVQDLDGSLTEDQLRRLRKRYFQQIKMIGGYDEQAVIIDILPPIALFHPLISALFPDARKIFIERACQDIEMHRKFFALEALPMGIINQDENIALCQKLNSLLEHSNIESFSGDQLIGHTTGQNDALSALLDFKINPSQPIVSSDYLPKAHWEHYA